MSRFCFERAIISLVVALIIEFILGVSLTTVVSYDPSKHTGVQSAFLIAHVVVALGLIVGALIRFALAIRWRWLRLTSAIGLACIIGDWISGGIATSSGAATAVLVMALFFIAALGAYGYGLFLAEDCGTAKNKSN